MHPLLEGEPIFNDDGSGGTIRAEPEQSHSKGRARQRFTNGGAGFQPRRGGLHSSGREAFHNFTGAPLAAEAYIARISATALRAS